MIRIPQFRHLTAPAVLGAAMLFSLQGCTTAERPDSVPAHANIISEGHETVATEAPHDGMVYITDSTDNKLVYSSHVAQGDNVQVNAKDDKILINDRVAMDSDLSTSDHYKIYFERSKTPDAQTASHQETMQNPSNNAKYNAPPAGSTVVQPSGTGATITQPDGTVVKPNGSVVQPNGTEVKQGENGSTTVVTPAR